MLVASRGLRHHARTLDDGLDPGLAPLPRMFAAVVAVEMHDVPSIVALAVQNLGPRNLIGRAPTGRDVARASVEQAGLDATPFERVQNYLLDRVGWTRTSEYVWYYSQFPEFIISPTGGKTRPVQAGENWVRSAINPSAFVCSLRIFFTKPCWLKSSASFTTK